MKRAILAVTFLLLVALLLRLPLVSAHSPYLYDEDEGHHYNRQVEMLKTGDLNPHYFLKPSFNFYLRLPVLSAGFLWSVKEKQVLSTEDIRTKDQFGLSGYNFTASQPAMLKADRLYSVLISLLIVAGVFYLTFLLSSNLRGSLLAAALATFSPLALEHSISVGVNQPTALFCLLSVIFATLFLKKQTWPSILLSSVFAGLAIGTKYNALPIVLIPIIATLLSTPIGFWKFFVSAKLPWLVFLCCSPFILLEIPLFLDHLAYEVWHYGVQGHEGNMSEPGIGQFLNYLNDIIALDIGLIALLFAFLALLFLVKEKVKFAIPTVLFIFFYFILMSAQRANFERNLLLVLPLIYSLTAYAFIKFSCFLKKEQLAFLLALLVLFQPMIRSAIYLQSKVQKKDSREAAFTYLNSAPNNVSKLAIDGTLQLPRFVIFHDGEAIITRENTKRVDFDKYSLAELASSGYQEVLLSSKYLSKITAKNYKVKKYFTGQLEESRVPENPAMWLVNLAAY